MYIPVLPPNPYTISIIHDELIYGDIFINPSDLGKNIKSTFISNIGEISLEHCLKTILEANKNTTFHTIQYSRKQKKLCFYTDTDLDITSWKEKEIQPAKNAYTQEEITKTIIDVFNNETIYDQDCTSIYEVLMIYKDLDKRIKQFHSAIENKISNKLKENVDSDIYCSVHDYDYDKDILPIHCSSRYSSFWDKYQYTKTPNGTSKENKIEGFHNYNMFGTVSNEISELIDFHKSIKETRIQKKTQVKAVNCNLFINMDRYDVEVYIDKNRSYYLWSTPLYKSKFYTYSDKIEHEYSYSDILEKLTGNETEFLQKIFIKIDDCPLWMRETLYNRRQEEIRERKRLEEEQLLREKELLEQTQLEENKQPPVQKKLSLFQKVFKKNNN